MIGQDDPELTPWLFGIVNSNPHPPWGFVASIANAALRADSENYDILRPALLQFKAKYPKYGESK